MGSLCLGWIHFTISLAHIDGGVVFDQPMIGAGTRANPDGTWHVGPPSLGCL